ncbi:MAG: cation:proton antiporter regulatory subunit [Dehalococcoidia bacterium]
MCSKPNPTAVEFLELVTHRQSLPLSLEEVTVVEASPINDLSIAEAEIRHRYGVIIMAIKRVSGDMVFNPDPSE